MDVMKSKPKLTRKQAAFVKELIKNPKQTATNAAMIAYGKPDKPVSYNVAHAIGSENLHKPAIISHLMDYNEVIENSLTNTAIEWSNEDDVNKRRLAIDTSKYIHDKIHGKATIRTENTDLVINVSDVISRLV